MKSLKQCHSKKIFLEMIVLGKQVGKPSPYLFRIMLLAIAIGVLYFGYSNGHSWKTSKTAPTYTAGEIAQKQNVAPSATKQILLAAAFGKGQIAIRNDNSFDWTNARIVVANGPTNQYGLKVGTIKSGETKQYALSEFVSSSGEIYDSRKYVPKQVFVYADNASGGKQY